MISYSYKHSKIYPSATRALDWNSVEIVSVEIVVVSKEKFTPKDN